MEKLSSAANEVASNPASFFLFLGEAGFEATNEDALKLGYPSLRPEQLEVAIQFYLAGMFLLCSQLDLGRACVLLSSL